MLAVDLCDRVESATQRARRRRDHPPRGSRRSGRPRGTGELRLPRRAGGARRRPAARRDRRAGRRRPRARETDPESSRPRRRELRRRGGLARDPPPSTASAIDAEERDRVLASIGSDCVFFARADATGFALCEGRGERVTPSEFPIDAARIAVVTPGTECPTAAVYAALRKLRGSWHAPADPAPRWSATDVAGARAFLGNDLEAAALEAFPDLRNWRRLLDENGAEAWRLSGSGSSFFGMHDDAREAEKALERVCGAGALARSPDSRNVASPSGATRRALSRSSLNLGRVRSRNRREADREDPPGDPGWRSARSGSSCWRTSATSCARSPASRSTVAWSSATSRSSRDRAVSSWRCRAASSWIAVSTAAARTTCARVSATTAARGSRPDAARATCAGSRSSTPTSRTRSTSPRATTCKARSCPRTAWRVEKSREIGYVAQSFEDLDYQAYEEEWPAEEQGG